MINIKLTLIIWVFVVKLANCLKKAAHRGGGGGAGYQINSYTPGIYSDTKIYAGPRTHSYYQSDGNNSTDPPGGWWWVIVLIVISLIICFLCSMRYTATNLDLHQRSVYYCVFCCKCKNYKQWDRRYKAKLKAYQDQKAKFKANQVATQQLQQKDKQFDIITIQPEAVLQQIPANACCDSQIVAADSLVVGQSASYLPIIRGLRVTDSQEIKKRIESHEILEDQDSSINEKNDANQE